MLEFSFPVHLARVSITRFEFSTTAGGGTPRVAVNFTTAGGAPSCGVLLYANSATAGTLDTAADCAATWAYRAPPSGAPPPAPRARKATTPPLFLYSLIVTGVLWAFVLGYAYRFAPRARRHDFPRADLAEAMLDISTQGDGHGHGRGGAADSTDERARGGVVRGREADQEKIFAM